MISHESITSAKTEALESVASASDTAALEAAELRYLSRKGVFASLFGELTDVPAAEKPALGAALNAAKQAVADAVRERKAALQSSAEQSVDVTLPGSTPKAGNRHPLMLMRERVEDIFMSMGYEVLDGPEIEIAKYNFDTLRIPENHPARDVWDTFYVEPGREVAGPDVPLLRTHISALQVRAMESREAPIRFISSGRVFRHEATDASHEANYFYCEGVAIEEGLTFGDLFGTLETFFHALFGKETETRFQPSFFPFVEPGGEVLMKGSRGWMEMLGCGMIHPEVLRNMGVDPERYTGFAFGMGIDRLMMYYNQVPDVRMSYQGDLRFLQNF